MSDDLDEQLRRAMASLDRQAPARYFDTLAERTLARLDDAAPDDFVAEEVVTEDEVIGEREEHSGLQDIRNLASETKARLARRTSQQIIARDDRIASSSAGWKAVALPDPGRRAEPEVAPVDELARERAARAAASIPAAPVTTQAAPRRRWVAIAGVTVAAAAGAVIFVSTRGADQADRAARPPAAAMAPSPTMPMALPRPIADSARNGAIAQGERPAPADPASAGSARNAAIAAGSNAAIAAGSGVGNAATPPIVHAGKAPAKPSAKGKGPGKLGKAPVDEPDAPVTKPAPVPTAGPVTKQGPRSAGKPGAAQGSDEPSFDELVHEAGIGSAAPAKPKLDRQSLSPDDIKRVLGAATGQARACFNGTEGTAAVRLTVAPSGKVTKVTTTGVFAGTPTAACVERAVKSATFPPWDGGPQSVAYSYLLSE